ncbi:MAG: Rqc2 family fibronectin-binding protein [Nitrospirales bacterium]
MAISLNECTAVLQEFNSILTSGAIQKIHQPQPFTLSFDIRVPGESFALLISVEPRFARLHLATKKLENPQTPLGFCQYLRSHLEGGRIESIQQEPGDRIVYFNIVKSLNRYVLVVALTGNQSNVFVLNEEKLILRSLKPSRLEIGECYVPPSVPMQTIAPSPLSPSLQIEGDSFQSRFPISVEIEKRFLNEVESQRRLEWFKARTSQVRKLLKQATRRKRTLEVDLANSEKYREYQRYGELLKSQLHTLTPRQSVVEVVDYYDPALPTLSLPLNELKDPVWNMEDYFRKSRKYVSAQEHILPRLDHTKIEIEALKEELAKLEKNELDELVEVSVSEKSGNTRYANPLTLPSPRMGQRKPKKGGTMQNQFQNIEGFGKNEQVRKTSSQAKHYRTFESFDGLTLLVGKSALDNDYLTLKVARPDDLWLHARGCPGSHVVIRLEKATDVPHETLRDAATLALFYSDLKKSGKGEVIYTLRKFVKKSKGMKAGAVQVTREKSLWIELKKERLDRLKGGA